MRLAPEGGACRVFDLMACLRIWLGAPSRRAWRTARLRAARHLPLRAPARPARSSPLAHAFHRLPEHTQKPEVEAPTDEGGDAVALVRPYLFGQPPRRAALLPGPRQTSED